MKNSAPSIVNFSQISQQKDGEDVFLLWDINRLLNENNSNNTIYDNIEYKKLLKGEIMCIFFVILFL